MNPFLSPFLTGGAPPFQQAQPPQAMAQPRPGLGSVLGPLAMGFGAALATDNPAAGFPIMQDAQKMRAQRSGVNATAKWLQESGNEDLIPMLQAGQGDMVMQLVRDRVKAKLPQASQYGLNPIYAQDEQGNPVLYQSSDSGAPPRAMQFPKGHRPLGPYDRSFQTGQGREEGKNRAEALERLPVMTESGKEVLGLADAVITHPGLEGATGNIQGRLPNWALGNQQRDFVARVEQLRGKAFLTARIELKGGGQITDYEGQRAEDALIRASRAQDEAAFREAIRDFKSAIERGYRILSEQAGQGQPAPLGGGQKRVQDMSDAELEALANGR